MTNPTRHARWLPLGLSLPAMLAAGLAVAACGPAASPKDVPTSEGLLKAAGGIVAVNAGRMVGKVKNGPIGLIESQGAAGLRLLATDGLIPVTGARVEVTDATGIIYSVGSATTDADGTFVIRRFKPSAGVLYVRAEYPLGDQTVVLRAVAVAPRKAGEISVTVDPAATLVTKKTLVMVRLKELDGERVDPALADKMARLVASEMDGATLATAALGSDAEAARAFDRLLDRNAALEDKLRQLASGGPMVKLLEPTPSNAAGTGGGKGNLALRPPTANNTTSAPGTVLLAGSGVAGFAEGPRAQAQFHVPYDVATDKAGNAYVADSDNHRIRKVAPDGTVSTVAGSEAGFADGPSDKALFNACSGVAVGPDGSLYVADYGNHRIRKITFDEQGAVTVSTLAGMPAPGFADGTGAAARFSAPSDLTVDPAGNVFVADTDNQRIRKITPDGVVTTIAGDGVGGFEDGDALVGRLSQPADVAIDSRGRLFVADTGNHAVRAVIEGRLTTLAGNGTAAFADGQGATARFNTPYGIAVGPGGNLYVADSQNNSVRIVSPVGGVTTFWGGAAGPTSDPPQGLFSQPSGVAIRPNAEGVAEVYVADAGVHVVRKFALGQAPRNDAGLAPK